MSTDTLHDMIKEVAEIKPAIEVELYRYALYIALGELDADQKEHVTDTVRTYIKHRANPEEGSWIDK